VSIGAKEYHIVDSCDVPIPIMRTTAIVLVTRWICTWATKKEEVDKWYDIIEDQSMMNSMT